jgi:hypothetical protein
MEVGGDRKSTWVSLDFSPLFFHILSKLVEARVTIYDEILQAQSVGGNVLVWCLVSSIFMTMIF